MAGAFGTDRAARRDARATGEGVARRTHPCAGRVAGRAPAWRVRRSQPLPPPPRPPALPARWTHQTAPARVNAPHATQHGTRTPASDAAWAVHRLHARCTAVHPASCTAPAQPLPAAPCAAWQAAGVSRTARTCRSLKRTDDTRRWRRRPSGARVYSRSSLSTGASSWPPPGSSRCSSRCSLSCGTVAPATTLLKRPLRPGCGMKMLALRKEAAAAADAYLGGGGRQQGRRQQTRRVRRG